jgi:hypothetical protein
MFVDGGLSFFQKIFTYSFLKIKNKTVMKKIYLSLVTVAMSLSLMAQTVVIGTDQSFMTNSSYRSPWSPRYDYSYVQSIYLQSEINTAGLISSISFFYAGSDISGSNDLSVWMGQVSQSEFADRESWEPLSNLTKVFEGSATFTSLPGKVTITLKEPFKYDNVDNLLIAIHDKSDGSSNDQGTTFHATESGTNRVIYFNDDIDPEDPSYVANPDPTAPPRADGLRSKVGNIEINFDNTTPVKFGSFTGVANAAANVLSWNTLTEQNNSGFDVQRSTDGSSFTTIGFVASKATNGNSNANIAYSFADGKASAGNNYYRLVQKDKDGKTAISDIVLIKNAAGSGARISATYPNPVTASLSIVISASIADKATIQIVDLAGKVVSQQMTAITAGNNNVKVNAAGLPSGVYTIKAILPNGKQTVTSKFVKQ